MVGVEVDSKLGWEVSRKGGSKLSGPCGLGAAPLTVNQKHAETDSTALNSIKLLVMTCLCTVAVAT